MTQEIQTPPDYAIQARYHAAELTCFSPLWLRRRYKHQCHLHAMTKALELDGR
jgi:hypothetical protein